MSFYVSAFQLKPKPLETKRIFTFPYSSKLLETPRIITVSVLTHIEANAGRGNTNNVALSGSVQFQYAPASRKESKFRLHEREASCSPEDVPVN